MKTTFFHLMPYPELPDDFPSAPRCGRHRSRAFDPRVGHRGNEYIDELEFAAQGFDAVGINEHHSNGEASCPAPT